MLASQLMTILYMYMMCMYPHNCLLPYTSFPGLVWNGYGMGMEYLVEWEWGLLL